MQYKRVLALLLAAVLLVGLLAGCSKKSETTPDGEKKPGSSSSSLIDQATRTDMSAKYAYKASYLDLDLQISSSIEWVNGLCAAGDNLYVNAYVTGPTVTESDGAGGEYSYTQSIFTLLLVDPQTGVCTELPNLQLPQVPEGCEGSVDCYNVSGAADGTVWMLINVYATKFELPEDFDPATQNKWDYPQTDASKPYLLHVAEDGSTLAQIDLSAVGEGEAADYSYIDNFVVDEQGNLYAYAYPNVLVLDAQGKLLFQLDNSENSGRLCAMRADEVGILWTQYSDDPNGSEDDGHYFTPIDLTTKSWGEARKVNLSVWSVMPGDDVYDYYYEYNYNIYGINSQTQEKEKLVDWMECDVDINNISATAMLADGRVAALRNDWSGDTRTYELVVLNRIDASELPQRTVLTLACYGLDWDLRSQIVEYNKTNEQYRIKILDYSEFSTDSDYYAGVTKLTTEIIGGSVPDLFLCGGLPVDKYAARGVIADLYSFIDQDTTMNRDYFVPQVLAALEKEGKLYKLPIGFTVQTAYALSSIADQYDTWDVAAVQDAMTQLQEGASVFYSGYTKNDALNNCLTRNLGTFVDWTTGKCEFDSEAFRQILAFCNSFPEATQDDGIAYATAEVVDAVAVDDWESEDSRIRTGKQLMGSLWLYSFDGYVYSTYSLKNKISFVGYPSQDGTTGSSFDVQTPMAISAVTEHPEAAWDFVKTMIEGSIEDTYSFPISQAQLDKLAGQAMTEELLYDENGNTVDWDEDGQPDKKAKGGYQTIEGDEYIWHDVYALTQEDVDQIFDIIDRTTGLYTYDEEIMNIVTEEVAAYFAGDKDVAATAAMIQSRVNLYVQEQR